MEFRDDVLLTTSPANTWRVLTDFRRVADCIPGCEAVEELTPLVRYRAVMKQRVGPFRVEAPLDITLEDTRDGERIKARATGRDTLTGTAIAAVLSVSLAAEGHGVRLTVATDLQVSGRLATLGRAVIRARAAETFAEFASRLRATVEAD